MAVKRRRNRGFGTFFFAMIFRPCFLDPFLQKKRERKTHPRLEPDKVEPLLGQRPRLVEAEHADLAADHDALGLQTVDPVALEAIQGLRFFFRVKKRG